MTDLEQIQIKELIRSEFAALARDLRNEFATAYGGSIRSHELILNGDGKNVLGLVSDVNKLKDAAKDQARNTRWILVILGLTFFAVLICLVFLVLLWIQVSVLSVRVM